MSDRSTDHEFERRQFIKTTGAAAGFGSLVGAARAVPGADLGTVRFVEVGLETDVPGVDDGDGALPVVHWDFPLPHAVDPDAGALYLRERIDDAAVRSLRREPAVVKTTGFIPAPATVLGGAHDTLPYELGPHYRRNYLLELEEAVRLPSVAVEPRVGGVTVSGGPVTTTVARGAERAFALDPIEATVELSEATDVRHESPDVPDRLLGFERRAWTETVEVEPTLRVNDHDELDVVDARDGLVVRQ